MARSKSIPGSKTNRAKVNKDQAEAGVGSEVSAGQTAAETKPFLDRAASDPIPSPKAPERTDGSSSELESKTAPDLRKFEVVRNEPRKNLVPINLDDEIRRRAYEIYEQRGAGAGSEAEDWFAAEREVRQRYRQQSA
jgi:hypothetical protein